ncbi:MULTISPECIES: TRAP transporter small permease [unclassified Nesterenkonia]|uniref:TRAP transporter small permease n=1 Tax=unclassified Nesterenkonia TaxID=2629769 RepID=UPI0021052F73|nr:MULTISPECIES: TRAP transporter small permease [unclassified Nesterenkonia]
MVAVTVDVLARNALGSSVPGLLEMSESALVATVFLGLAYTGTTNSHVSVDLLTEKLPRRMARKIAGVVWLLGSLMVTWFIYASFERAMESTASGEITVGLMDWPLWPARWLIVIGYVAFLLVALVNTYLSFRNELLLGEENDSNHLSIDEENSTEENAENVSKDRPSQGEVKA